MSYRELINERELQHLQDEVCSVLEVLAYCIDAEGKEITRLSGSEEAKQKMPEYVTADMLQTILSRVEEGSLEDFAIEEIEGTDVKIAAVAVRVEEDTVFYWVVADVNGTKDSVQFFQVLDLLRDTSYTLLVNKISSFSAEAEKRKSQYAQQAMRKDLHALEATTAIVQLLDSDDPIEKIMDGWLNILSEHLQPDTTEIFQLHTDGATMDVLCEWRKPDLVSAFDQTRNVSTIPFLYTEKPLVLTIDTCQNEYRDAFEYANIKSVMVFPILRQENGGMILVMNHREQKYTWNMEEIKFTADAVKILQNVLTKRIQKNSLASSYEALESILDNVGCAIYVMDKGTRSMLFANRRLQKIFGRELKDNRFQGILQRGVCQDQTSGAYELFLGEKEQWYDLLYKEIAWVDGREAVLYSLYDITDKKLYQKKIEQQAYTDFLTGLYNRMCCERDLARQIDEAKRNGETGAILYLDLDDFKHINDGLGHQYGDILLKSISQSLKDIEGIQRTCYRMGGDEFVIVVPPGYYAELDRIIDDIRQIFSKPWFLKDGDYYCTMSMGIVTFPDSGEFVADLVKKADIAMYEAKKSGKNRISRYKDGIDSVSGRRLDIEKNMRDATVGGYKEFQVYYQPIINVENGETRCVGAEALIRWNSQNLGFVPPAEFIPLAEYLGLINPIGNYVLKEACFHCKEWNDNGHPDYKVNVNLSVVQLLQADIVEIVERTLQETQIQPCNLTLEVTESLAINDMERMKEILNKIKSLGVKIALDDFGTGYSSLNHIREIPVDVIKVDQIFVRDLTADPYSQSFIKMIAELGETIGVSICVEGVETGEQHQVLQGMKVKYAQGYFFDRPMPRADFEKKYVS